MTTTTRTLSYITRYTDGTNGSTHERRADALAEIQSVMGWDSIVESNDYTQDIRADGRRVMGDGVSCYETQEACDADQDGAMAPMIWYGDLTLAEDY